MNKPKSNILVHMRKPQEKFRLPDGKWTTNAVKMSRAWARIYKPIEKALDLTVIGFDHGISFRTKGQCYGYFSLPTNTAIKLSNILKKE